jgi:transposase
MPPRRPLRAVSGNIVKRKELTPFTRGKILGRHGVGESAHTISQALGIPRRTVRDTINKKDIRSEGKSKERSGQPRKLTQRAIRRIFRVIKEEPFITYRQLRDKLNLDCSPSTILRALKDSKWGHWRAAKRPRLTAEHAKLRLEFVNRYKDWDWEEWSKVIFSDECSIELGSGKRTRWVFRVRAYGEKWRKDLVQDIKKGKGVRVMVWAAIWGDKRSDLIQLERDFDSKKNRYSSKSYLKVIEEILPTIYEPGLHFMQDNAPIHTSNELKAWFADNGVKLLDWPPYSPDLNPIENLWFPLKEGVYIVDPDIENTPGGEDMVSNILAQAAQQSWEDLHTSLIKNCVGSMKRRLAAVIEAEGWYTGY